MRSGEVYRNKSEGFTLVEVLTVTAIIALLAGIILTASGPARRAAQVAGCMSNLRQIGMAYSMYLSDYGQYPALGLLTLDAGRVYLKDRRVLNCPGDTEGLLDSVNTSYSEHIYAPPDGVRLGSLHAVAPDFVLTWCDAHARPREVPLGAGRIGTGRVFPSYPYYLVLRADGHVDRVHRDRVRFFRLKNSYPNLNAFVRAFPGEQWYDRAQVSMGPSSP